MDKKLEGSYIQNQFTLPRLGFSALLVATLLTSCSNSSGFQTVAGSALTTQSTTTTTSVPPTTTTGTSTGGVTNGVFSAGYTPQALSWESASDPERTAWSTTAYGIVNEHFTALDKATDISTFCPTYASLSKDQKINLWADLFASDAYYESGWDPTEYSVDVGTEDDSDTWSVGLLQMSVVDQQNYNLSLNYDFADLQTVAPNLELGITIMSLQIAKYGTVLINKGSPGLYWSTMDPGGKDDQSANIEARTKSLSFCQ